MTQHRAGLSPDGLWQVERSADGRHAEVIASRLPTAKAARLFIDAREGRLTPLRSGPDDSPVRVRAERFPPRSPADTQEVGSAAEG